VQEEKVRATEEQRQNVLTRIINRLESIDGKWKTFETLHRISRCYHLSLEFRFYGSVLLILIHDLVFSQEEKHANGRLRADIKLKSQDLKVQEEKVRATEEQRQNVLTRIINRCF
jgi:hypothetical protein